MGLHVIIHIVILMSCLFVLLVVGFPARATAITKLLYKTTVGSLILRMCKPDTALSAELWKDLHHSRLLANSLVDCDRIKDKAKEALLHAYNDRTAVAYLRLSTENNWDPKQPLHDLYMAWACSWLKDQGFFVRMHSTTSIVFSPFPVV